MTLTHGCNTPWADAAQVEVGDFPPRVGGLSEKVVLNRNQFDWKKNQRLSAKWTDWGCWSISHMCQATQCARCGKNISIEIIFLNAMLSSIQALEVTRAPVIFSHSGARAICSYPRKVLYNSRPRDNWSLDIFHLENNWAIVPPKDQAWSLISAKTSSLAERYLVDHLYSAK